MSGYPEGSWVNLVSWSRDSRHVAFAIRSPGASVCCIHEVLLQRRDRCVHACMLEACSCWALPKLNIASCLDMRCRSVLLSPKLNTWHAAHGPQCNSC